MDTKYNIIIAHPNKMFDAEKIKGDAIVFVNNWSENNDECELIECASKQQRNLLLSIMDNTKEKNHLYTLGYSHGLQKKPYSPEF